MGVRGLPTSMVRNTDSFCHLPDRLAIKFNVSGRGGKNNRYRRNVGGGSAWVQSCQSGYSGPAVFSPGKNGAVFVLELRDADQV